METSFLLPSRRSHSFSITFLIFPALLLFTPSLALTNASDVGPCSCKGHREWALSTPSLLLFSPSSFSLICIRVGERELEKNQCLFSNVCGPYWDIAITLGKRAVSQAIAEADLQILALVSSSVSLGLLPADSLT